MPPSEESGGNHLVFIYGTLKQGYPNSHHMPASAEYVGTACTTIPFPLVVDTEMSVPYLLLIRGHPDAKIVQGELYRVDASAVEHLDNFEGLRTGFYIREQLDLIHPCPTADSIPEPSLTESVINSPRTVITATAYFRSPVNGGPEWARKWTVEKLLTLPMVGRYSSEHALRFVARTERGY